mgnify:CR=1 FL=1
MCALRWPCRRGRPREAYGPSVRCSCSDLRDVAGTTRRLRAMEAPPNARVAARLAGDADHATRPRCARIGASVHRCARRRRPTRIVHGAIVGKRWSRWRERGRARRPRRTARWVYDTAEPDHAQEWGQYRPESAAARTPHGTSSSSHGSCACEGRRPGTPRRQFTRSNPPARRVRHHDRTTGTPKTSRTLGCCTSWSRPPGSSSS